MTKSEKELLKLYQALPEQGQKSLLDYSRFLSKEHPVTSSEDTTPKELPRPEKESVVLAMRRLSDTYFMLNKDDILHQASSLMSQHILQGRDAVEVIDELEDLFKSHYNQYIENK